MFFIQISIDMTKTCREALTQQNCRLPLSSGCNKSLIKEISGASLPEAGSNGQRDGRLRQQVGRASSSAAMSIVFRN